MLAPNLPGLLFVASAGVLVWAQGPPAPAAGCTSNSFAIPSWFVQDLEVSGTGASQNVHFNLLNRATNGTTDVVCELRGAGGNKCAVEGKALEASVEVKGGSVQISVNQIWSCNDRVAADRLQFRAVGNGSLPLQASKASISPFLIRGSLVSPVAIEPIYATGPTGHDAKGCTTDAPTWVLDSILYEEQSADGVNSHPYQLLSLRVTNPANGYQASCMAGDIEDAGPASALSVPLVCAGTEFQDSRIGRYSISTSGRLDLPSFTFSLDQTWYCDDVDPSKPVAIAASGSLPVSLKCESAIVSGSNHTKCYTDRATIKGSVVSKTALAPYSVEDPLPARDGCTLTSIFNPQWSFSSFVVDETKASPVITFEMILQTQNRGYQYPISVSQGAPVAGNSSWYQCEIGPDGENAQPLWPYRCSFKYNKGSGEFTLQADWSCADLDPARPISFSGTTTTKVEKPLGCQMVGEQVECETDTANSWTAKISDVTWGALP